MIRIYCEGQGWRTLAEGPRGEGDFTSDVWSSVGRQLTKPVARDMLRIGEAAFLADRAFLRGGRLGQQTRVMTVVVPVEDRDRWQSVAVDIARLAQFVSQDRWSFEFTAIKRKPRVRSDGVNLETVRFPTSVNLFSDGLDSLC